MNVTGLSWTKTLMGDQVELKAYGKGIRLGWTKGLLEWYKTGWTKGLWEGYETRTEGLWERDKTGLN